MFPDPQLAFGTALTAPRYRTVEEKRIIAMLASPYAIAAGRRADDAQEVASIIDRLVALGLPHRLDGSGQRLFDPVEVDNGIQEIYYRLGEPIWLDRPVSILRRLISEMAPGGSEDTPPDLGQLGVGRYSVRHRRRFNLAGRRTNEMVRLRLPVPLDGLCDARLMPLAGIDAEATLMPGRFELRLPVPETGEIEIGVTSTFTADPAALHRQPPPDAALSSLLLRRREGLINVDDRITDLARRITSGAATPAAMMARLWDHLFDHFRAATIHYDQIDAADPLGETLRTRRIDCRTGSSLLIALCRALGMPARLMSGYTLNPLKPTLHSWCEVWLPDQGWNAYDLFSMVLAGGERNSPWRQHFFGRIDHRFVTERLPLEFCGTGAVRLPTAWQLVRTRPDEGTEDRFEELDSGALVYSDSIDVSRHE